jgi:hypothetical protein
LLGCNDLMIPLVLFATALLVRLAVGVLFSGPAYPDAYYYAHVAQQLAAGNGFTSDYLWNLADAGGALPALAHLPVPANALWMPLAELVQLPLLALFGGGTFAPALTFALIGALAAPLTYWMGRDLGLGARASVVGGLMVAVPAGLTPFVAQPDNFALLMVLGPLALWLCARGSRGDTTAFVLGGLVVGLATLARFDGVLLALPFVLVFMRQGFSGGARVLSAAAAAGFVGVLALVLAPWLVRQWLVFGSPVPGAGTLWLTNYQQLFSFSSAPSFDGWLAQGFVQILTNHLGGLLSALGLFALLPLAVVLAPFAATGAWARRQDPAFVPFFVYAVAVFLVVGVGFAVLVPHGTFLHAAAGLVPHTFLLVAVGVERAVRWAAA